MALANEPTPFDVKIADLDISGEGDISLMGVPLQTEGDKVQRQLLKMFGGLNKTFLKNYGKLTGKEFQEQLIKTIKLGLSTQKGAKVTIIGNPETQKIFGIMPFGKQYVPNTFAIESFERVMNMPQNKDCKIQNFEILGNGGVAITAVRPDAVTPNLHGGPKVGEEFNPGFGFNNNPITGLDAYHFVNRLTCTNGNYIIEKHGGFTMTQLTDGQVQKLFDAVQHMSDNNFIPPSFETTLNRALSTPASLAEMMYARRMMKMHSSLESDENLAAFLPQFGRTVAKLAQKGFDYEKATDVQLKNCPVSGVTVWDIVNVMTDFGSHDYAYNASFAPIQFAAGKLFAKDHYDAENLLLANALMN
ncbi:MAG TPA: hypothetical protein VEC37_10115 [Bacillota bacterium]|nr:hypothetical protein [Bacillota bacterium]